MGDLGGAISGLSPTDEELMHLVQHGDNQAFQALFGRYKGSIWTFLMRRTGDRQASSDLYQEVFLRVWRSARTFRAGQTFRPWLYRITRNVLHDQYRKRQRQVQTVEMEEWTPGRLIDPIATHDLEKAIETLPINLKEAFLLGAVHGLDHKEVATAK